MRFIIYGAGGIGGTIGARLFQHGQEVILIARGPHYQAVKDKGLVFNSPVESVTLPIPCVDHPSNIEYTDQDVVLLAMKSQHTREALEALRDAAGADIPVICAQNGVDNERAASRRFNRVYGMVVLLPASHFDPGVVQTEAKTTTGILDIGCYPNGTDALCEEVAKILSGSQFDAIADPAIMRWKYAKLLVNLGNSLQAVCEAGEAGAAIYRMLMREAVACYKAAGIDCASRDEVTERRGDIIQSAPVKGETRGGGSSWQSIVRGTGSIESDYLNGEIVLLGKLHGVATPANSVLQQLANQLATERGQPGSYQVADVKNLIIKAGGKFSD